MERKPLVIINGRVQELPNGDTLVGGETVPTYTKRIDFVSDDEMYQGFATPGTSESSALWQIQKIVVGIDGDVTITFANGNANFTNSWSSRLSYTYS